MLDPGCIGEIGEGMRTILSPLTILLLIPLVQLPSENLVTASQKGSRQIRIARLGEYSGYKGGVLVEWKRILVFDHLSDVYDEKLGKKVDTPEGQDKPRWKGEEFYQTTYVWSGNAY